MQIYQKQDGVPKFLANEYENKTKDYVVLIPIINENGKIQNQLKRMKNCNIADIADIVICDGDSSDGCTEEKKLRSLDVNSLLVKKDTGRQGAQLRMGIWWSLKRGYIGIITIDGNNKDSVEDIRVIINKLKEGFDFIQASRFMKGGKGINTPISRSLAIRLIHAPLISIASGMKFTDTTSAYRGYSRRYLEDKRVQLFRDIFDSYELLFYLSIKANRLGYKACEMPVTRTYPKNEKVPTKISFFKGNFEILINTFKAVFGYYNPKYK